MNRNLLFILSAIFLISFSTAQEIDYGQYSLGDFSDSEIQQAILGQMNNEELIIKYLETFGCSQIAGYTEEIVGEKIPDKIPFKNEIINFYVANVSFGNLIIEDGILLNFSCEENLHPSYKIYIQDYSTFLDFSTGFDMDLLIEKLESKEILVKGVGFSKKIKWFFSKIAIKWFFD